MKRAPKTTLLTSNGKSKIYGILCHADFVAEHEVGLTGIHKTLGVDRLSALGVEAYRVHNLEGLVYREGSQGDFLFTSDLGRDVDYYMTRYFQTEYTPEDAEMMSIWTAESFMLYVKSPESRKFLAKLWAQKDSTGFALCKLRTPDNPFSGSHLAILNIKNFPQSLNKDWLARDRAYLKKVSLWESSQAAKTIKKRGIRGKFGKSFRGEDINLCTYFRGYNVPRVKDGWYSFKDLQKVLVKTKVQA